MSHIETPDEITPNKVIENPATRRALGKALYFVALAAGLAGLFFGFFPEFGSDVAFRAVAFVTSAVSLISAAFGLVVTTPNVPKRA